MVAHRPPNSRRRRVAKVGLVFAMIAFWPLGLGRSKAGPVKGVGQPSSSQDRILLEVKEGAARSVLAVGESYLQLPRLERLYRSLLTSDLPPRHAIFVAAYPDVDSENWMADGQPFENFSFDQWRDVLLRVRREHPWRAARVVATMDGVVVQVAKDGKYSSTVISGKDPTKFSLGGAGYELLHAEFRQQVQGGEPFLLAFVRADQFPSLEGAKLLTEAIRAKFPANHLMVSIRPDIWFVYDSFPVWFPFCPQGRPPTWEEFSHTNEIICNNKYFSMSCSYLPLPVSPRIKFGQPPAEAH